MLIDHRLTETELLELDLLELERFAPLAPEDWEARVELLFGAFFWYPFSSPHRAIWEWASAIDPASTARPFVAIWPRGRGKSTHAEAIAADLGARKQRRYCMYVCATQDQADKHVQTIARMLESDAVNRYYPAVGEAKVSKHGNRQWNRRIVHAANGYTVEAVGLNKAVRGQKIDWARPDLIIFDDIDEKHDSDLTRGKKEDTITGSILPAGAANAAVLFVQNLISEDSIANRLARNPGDPLAAGYLMERMISGPYPAVDGLKYEPVTDGDKTRWQITMGESLWDGFTLAVCADELNRVGPTAYLIESQHEVDTDNPLALLSEADFKRTRVDKHPLLARVAVAVDPPASVGQCGIVAGGIAKVGGEWHGYTLEDNTTPPGVKPGTWAIEVLKTYHRTRADIIFCEVNNGGDMVEATIRGVKWLDDAGNVIVDGGRVRIEKVRASRGKRTRAEPVGVVFEQGRAHHVGHFPELEQQWRRWQPGDDSPDRLDAEVWLYTGLGLSEQHDPPKVVRYA